MIDPDCKVCEGSGLVAPSPFYEARISWPSWLLEDHRIRVAICPSCKTRPKTATNLGFIRPIVCPSCNADGVVEGNPWNVRETASFLH